MRIAPAAIAVLATACNVSGDPSSATLTISLGSPEVGAIASSAMISLGRSEVPRRARSLSCAPNLPRRHLVEMASSAYLVMLQACIPITESHNIHFAIIPEFM
jgi:hypothetical protein